MKTLKHLGTQAGWTLTLMGCLLLFSVPFAVAQNEADASLDGAVVVKGIVKHISAKKKRITLKPVQGERIKIFIDDQTAYVKMKSFDELQKDRPIRVWYTVDGDTKKAVKIEKLPNGSC